MFYRIDCNTVPSCRLHTVILSRVVAMEVNGRPAENSTNRELNSGRGFVSFFFSHVDKFTVGI